MDERSRELFVLLSTKEDDYTETELAFVESRIAPWGCRTDPDTSYGTRRNIQILFDAMNRVDPMIDWNKAGCVLTNIMGYADLLDVGKETTMDELEMFLGYKTAPTTDWLFPIKSTVTRIGEEVQLDYQVGSANNLPVSEIVKVLKTMDGQPLDDIPHGTTTCLFDHPPLEVENPNRGYTCANQFLKPEHLNAYMRWFGTYTPPTMRNDTMMVVSAPAFALRLYRVMQLDMFKPFFASCPDRSIVQRYASFAEECHNIVELRYRREESTKTIMEKGGGKRYNYHEDGKKSSTTFIPGVVFEAIQRKQKQAELAPPPSKRRRVERGLTLMEEEEDSSSGVDISEEEEASEEDFINDDEESSDDEENATMQTRKMANEWSETDSSSNDGEDSDGNWE
jgi:hypothetical protein